MSIGNDIKPRKVYYPGQNNQPRKDKPDRRDFDDQKIEEYEEEKDVEISKDSGTEHTKSPEALEEIEREFFDTYKQRDREPKPSDENTTDSRIIRIGPGKIVLIMVGILIVILIVQNFSSITNFILPPKTAKTVQSTDKTTSADELYTNDSTASNSGSTANSTGTTATPTLQTPAASSTSKGSTAASSTTDKSAINLKVLNGNGITGSAAGVADQLRTAGFTVGAVTNAKNFAYSTTIIYYKTGKSTEADLVKNSITGKTTSTELSDSAVGTADVVVVVGKK